MRLSYIMPKCMADKSEIRGVAARLSPTADTSDSEIISSCLSWTISQLCLIQLPSPVYISVSDPAMKFGTSLIMSLLSTTQIVLSQWKCDSRVYGRPPLDQCARALTSMPDATAKSPTIKLAAIRKFVEPQYLEPPFSRCHNERDAPMEQLPKFWRFSQSERLHIT